MKNPFRRRLLWGIGALIIVGVAHRLLQLWLVWPQLVVAIEVASNNQVMQLLPKAIMSDHPWWGLWFLQQSPPLPNLIWAAALAVTQSPHQLALIFILFQALLSCLAATAMALLFVRCGIRGWLGVVLSLIFLLGSDLLLLEYVTMGQFFYETLTMLFGLLACHAALTLLRAHQWQSACWLGFWITFMALSRATFSYFSPIALLWLMVAGYWRKPKLIAAFLFPVLLLQGGWALKNYYVHDYWSWSTSSWGGANIQQGERNRNGTVFNRWAAQQSPVCASPWHELTASEPAYFFFAPVEWNELPAAVAARDRFIAEKRGALATLDTVGMRMWAECLQAEFIQYWREHPEKLIHGAWRSYQIFWLPIRQFAVTQPYPIRIEMDAYSEGVHWMRALRDAWAEWTVQYSMRQAPLRLAPPENADYVPTTIIAMPFFASFISAFNFALIHSLPLLIFFSVVFTRAIGWRKGFSFLLLIFGYLAAVSSIVEYGENMRFRISVEPIIWVACVVIGREWFRFFNYFRSINSGAVIRS